MIISLSLLKYIWQLCLAKFSAWVTFFGTGRDTQNMDRQTFVGKHYFRFEWSPTVRPPFARLYCIKVLEIDLICPQYTKNNHFALMCSMELCLISFNWQRGNFHFCFATRRKIACPPTDNKNFTALSFTINTIFLKKCADFIKPYEKRDFQLSWVVLAKLHRWTPNS